MQGSEPDNAKGQKLFGLSIRLGEAASPLAAMMNRPRTALGFSTSGGAHLQHMKVLFARWLLRILISFPSISGQEREGVKN